MDLEESNRREVEECKDARRVMGGDGIIFDIFFMRRYLCIFEFMDSLGG